MAVMHVLTPPQITVQKCYWSNENNQHLYTFYVHLSEGNENFFIEIVLQYPKHKQQCEIVILGQLFCNK